MRVEGKGGEEPFAGLPLQQHFASSWLWSCWAGAMHGDPASTPWLLGLPGAQEG